MSPPETATRRSRRTARAGKLSALDTAAASGGMNNAMSTLSPSLPRNVRLPTFLAA